MKSVSKAVRAEIERAVDDVRDKAAEVTIREALLSAAMRQPVEDLLSAVSGYNEAVDALNDVLDSVIEGVEGYVEQRSDRWREGEAAGRYDAWLDRLRDAKVEPFEAPDIPDIDLEGLAEDCPAPPLALDEVDG